MNSQVKGSEVITVGSQRCLLHSGLPSMETQGHWTAHPEVLGLAGPVSCHWFSFYDSGTLPLFWAFVSSSEVRDWTGCIPSSNKHVLCPYCMPGII